MTTSKPTTHARVISKTFLKRLREEINQALESVAEKNQIKIHCGNCSFGKNEADYKLKINTINLLSGKVMTKEYEDLLWMADMKDFDINGIYDLYGKKVSLEGYKTRATKYPLIVLDLDNGQKYKAPKSWFLNVVVGSNKQ
tara:strand:+ start:53 stop:475 length:423 start_codon:yes stop_codon:yes gene_type:complete